MKPRTLAWVDGVNSAVMAYLALQADPDVVPVHCDLGTSVHPDSHRFVDDLERWYGKPIVRVRSAAFANVDEVFEKRKYLSGPKGAPCTSEMKVAPRLDFSLPSDTHLWGYAADKTDAKRFALMLANHPLLKQRAPLVEMGLTKRDTHAFLELNGIKRPIVYDLGMPNGNCLCCVKASSPRYWALMRQQFPVEFALRCAQARKFGARLVILGQAKGPNGKKQNLRCFPDEVPLDTPTTVRAADFGGCGIHCTADA